MKPAEFPTRLELQLFWLRTQLDRELVDATATSLVLGGIFALAPLCGLFGLIFGGISAIVTIVLFTRAWIRVYRTGKRIRELDVKR